MGVTQSMSRKRNPHDNAHMESFDKTLKAEKVDLQEYLDLDDARQHPDRFIGEFYDRERLRSSLGYVPLVEFAARYYSA
ncbi:integrase core domain-containing protein [Deinococcus altitudinis]|uniref:integrase core domain-containing protein n=1 Tax=Deinococcus altitudinis TaxID=468914 RepID=UPI003891D596